MQKNWGSCFSTIRGKQYQLSQGLQQKHLLEVFTCYLIPWHALFNLCNVSWGGAGRNGFTEEFVCSPWNIFLSIATFFGNEVYSRNKKKNALQPHFHELLECVLLQRWPNLVQMASPFLSSDILSVCLHCRAELQQKPPVSPLQAGELRTKWWSHLNGCTTHIGNESPLSLSETYAASVLSWANHWSMCFSFPDVSNGPSELQPNWLCVQKKARRVRLLVLTMSQWYSEEMGRRNRWGSVKLSWHLSASLCVYLASTQTII